MKTIRNRNFYASWRPPYVSSSAYAQIIENLESWRVFVPFSAHTKNRNFEFSTRRETYSSYVSFSAQRSPYVKVENLNFPRVVKGIRLTFPPLCSWKSWKLSKTEIFEFSHILKFFSLCNDNYTKRLSKIKIFEFSHILKFLLLCNDNYTKRLSKIEIFEFLHILKFFSLSNDNYTKRLSKIEIFEFSHILKFLSLYNDNYTWKLSKIEIFEFSHILKFFSLGNDNYIKKRLSKIEIFEFSTHCEFFIQKGYRKSKFLNFHILKFFSLGNDNYIKKRLSKIESFEFSIHREEYSLYVFFSSKSKFLNFSRVENIEKYSPYISSSIHVKTIKNRNFWIFTYSEIFFLCTTRII